MMMELAQFLHFAGRAPLRPAEHQLAAYVGHLYWLHGQRQAIAVLRPSHVRSRGRVGASKMHAGRTIRGLEGIGMLVRVAEYRFELVDDASAWSCWRPGEHERVAAEWQLVLQPPDDANEAVAQLLNAFGLRFSPHPSDSTWSQWATAVADLNQQFGPDIVRTAIAEAALDPDVVFPRRPAYLAELIYPLVQRNRRRNAV